ncbi:MAG: zinc dependent phospholipase C family protein, partial [Patescibacteria group bacterium]
YPGGSANFSKTVHNRGRTGAFLRTLAAEAVSVKEDAFVAGWALHVYADAVIHPLVDKAVKNFYRGADKSQLMLWHMRLEWGLDCAILESEEAKDLWQPNLMFPKRKRGDILTLAVNTIYPTAVFFQNDIQRGYDSIVKWSKIIPRIFLWSGNVSFLAGGSAYWHNYTNTPLRRAAAGLGWLLKGLGYETAGAILSPRRDYDLLTQAVQSADIAVKHFFDGYRIDFALLNDQPFGSVYAT